MKRRSPFGRLLKCFASLFPTNYNRKTYNIVLTVASEEEDRAHNILFDYDQLVFPKILQDMEKRGYYTDVEDIKKYLYRYCLIYKDHEQNG